MTRVRTDQYSETMIVRSRGRLLARALAILFAVALLAQLVHVALARDSAAVEAPDFALRSVAGPNVRLSEYRSEVVALAFAASWCGDCRAGLSALDHLHQSLAADGLRVVAVSFDNRVDQARQFAAATGSSYPVLMDPEGEVGRLYHVNDLPFVVLVDRSGRIRHSFHGSRAVTDPALTAEIRALLAE